eukprot:5469752-Ditylum_brightwellii.AAC.2
MIAFDAAKSKHKLDLGMRIKAWKFVFDGAWLSNKMVTIRILWHKYFYDLKEISVLCPLKQLQSSSFD